MARAKEAFPVKKISKKQSRKNISRMKGEHVLFDEIRYFFYITIRG